MIENATLIACDDLRFEIGNKITIVGAYSGGIRIAPGPFPVNKLMFLFQIQGNLEEIPKKLEVEVTLPNAEPKRVEIAVPQPYLVGTTTWTLRGVVLVMNEMVEAGPILAKVIADGQERLVAAPWFVSDNATSAVPIASPPPSGQSQTSRKKTRKLL